MKYLTIHKLRNDHAKSIRQKTGTNSFRDKKYELRDTRCFQCITTSKNHDNLLAIEYD